MAVPEYPRLCAARSHETGHQPKRARALSPRTVRVVTAFSIGRARLELVHGDIVDQAVDAIVNAANSSLAPGGGVCGAIHRAAGRELARDCAALGGCPAGEARLTRGYKLSARYVIHAVGPVFSGGEDDARLLASAYRSSLELAAAHGINSIAFPALSTGIYGYPIRAAAPIAIRTVDEFLLAGGNVELVRFVFLSHESYNAYELAARAMLGDPVHG